MLSVWNLTFFCLGVGFALGWIACASRRRNLEFKESQRIYSEAVAQAKAGQWVYSLALFGEALGHYNSHSILDAIGAVWNQLGHYSLAADAYRRARHLVWNLPHSRSATLRNRTNAELAADFYARESLAYARDGNWEFAYLRSHIALQMIEDNLLPRWVEYGDCESWLHLTRLVAALNHLPPDEALASAKADALWLTTNSHVSGYSRLAALALEDKPYDVVKTTLTAAWIEDDRSKRQEVFFPEPLYEDQA